jgi:hypothetical protein
MTKCTDDFKKAQDEADEEKAIAAALERIGVDKLGGVSGRHIRLSNILGDSSPHKP